MINKSVAITSNYIPWYKNTQFILSASILALSWADAYVTEFNVANGFGREGNFFMGRLVGNDAFVAIKLLGTAFALAILWDIYRRHPKLAGIATCIFTAIYCAIVWWNVGIAGTGVVLAYMI